MPATTFALKSAGDHPYLVSDGTDLTLTDTPPTASLGLVAEAAGGGAVTLRTKEGGKPVVIVDGRLTLGAEGADPTALRLTDAGGGKLFIRSDADGDSYATEGDNGKIQMGDRQRRRAIHPDRGRRQHRLAAHRRRRQGRVDQRHDVRHLLRGHQLRR